MRRWPGCDAHALQLASPAPRAAAATHVEPVPTAPAAHVHEDPSASQSTLAAASHSLLGKNILTVKQVRTGARSQVMLIPLQFSLEQVRSLLSTAHDLRQHARPDALKGKAC